MNTIATRDGTQIFFKDWGQGQPIVFSHGWPPITEADTINQDLLAFIES